MADRHQIEMGDAHALIPEHAFLRRARIDQNRLALGEQIEIVPLADVEHLTATGFALGRWNGHWPRTSTQVAPKATLKTASAGWNPFLETSQLDISSGSRSLSLSWARRISSASSRSSRLGVVFEQSARTSPGLNPWGIAHQDVERFAVVGQQDGDLLAPASKRSRDRDRRMSMHRLLTSSLGHLMMIGESASAVWGGAWMSAFVAASPAGDHRCAGFAARSGYCGSEN